MDFRTELSVIPATHPINLSDKLVTIGSCFADDMGARLLEGKFNVLKNPTGTIYNPISIHRLLNHATEQASPSQQGFLDRDGLFYHFDFHSEWSDSTQDFLNQKLSGMLAEVHRALATSQFLIITYGTAWVYEHKSLNSIVANCHKVHQQNFNKCLLTQKKIIESFEGFYGRLKKLNPACRLILTVSPVRHIKDTLELNSLSKSVLRLTCHTLAETFPDVTYFPAYEIMLDDLRDYRFYKPDMIHPSEQAIDYIWNKFVNAFFDSETKAFSKEWEKIRLALQHRPFQPASQNHQIFLTDLLEKLNAVKGKVDLAVEIEMVKRQISINIIK
jgi:hypothetical protein